MRTRERIEAQATEQKPANKPKSKRGDVSRIAKWQWKPGQSGNPAGRPKMDMAQVIAREIFENNPELLYKSYAALLKKGSAFGFQVLAERAYGKLKETREIGSELNEVADPDLQERVAQLERELYPAIYPNLTREADEAAGIGSTEGGASKTNGHAQDPHVLPGNGTIKA